MSIDHVLIGANVVQSVGPYFSWSDPVRKIENTSKEIPTNAADIPDLDGTLSIIQPETIVVANTYKD